ncbi:restriction endonuclease subunit S [uncultured Haemophilus sp.]|jgi:hypothetical protein|uniref:restriction endonuclease subunit S n=1 Tax=uncultured Haemophilus sp. TaxID=237779 RepID=UPI0025D21D05|nr:restriction endonuclease subunit S [uncultured Haemophilus sp.]
MSDWKEYSLGDISRNISRRFDFNAYPNVVFINTGDVLNNQFLHCDISNVKDLPGQAKKAIKKGDILYSEIRPGNGRYLFVDNDLDNYVVSTKFMVIEPNANIVLPEFLFLLLISNETTEYFKMIAESRSGTFPQITFDSVSSLSLNIPDKETQQKILDIITPLDDKIELNTQINQTLEQIAQALFKSWFVDFDPVRAKVQALSDGLNLEQAELAAMQAISGKTPEELTALSQIQPECYAELAETAKAFPCEMMEVDGVEVPKGWEVLNANDVIEFNPKETLKKDTLAYYLDMASLPTQGCSPDLPILRKFTSGTRFRNGDTLFARITPCLENGKTAFIQYLPEGTVAWGSTEYIVMRTKGIIPKPYSYLLARYESFREYAIRSMTGTSGRQRTQLDIIETYKVVSPSDNKLWESFSKIINPIFETINSNTNKNITLYNIRDLLLPKLLNEVI